MRRTDQGDVTWSRHRFTAADFDAFAAATGDHNPLHHDHRYCTGTDFGTPIVPLVMALGPVSALVGMGLPGPGAVILESAFRPVHPVLFDRDVVYSLRVSTVSASTGVFTCRLLAIQDGRVVLEGEVRSMLGGATVERNDAAGQLIRATDRNRAVVTGAGGDIGSAVARELGRRGWDLLLVHRHIPDGFEDLVSECRRLGSDVQLVQCDLALSSDRSALMDRLTEVQPTAFVHAAAPPLTTSHQEQFEVGYAAFRDLSTAVLEGMLLRQRGFLVLLGSEASRYHPPQWMDYIAAKAAAGSVLTGIDRRLSGYGVRAIVVEPSYVDGTYSAGARPRGHIGLIPEEVAEVIAAELDTPDRPSVRIWLTPEKIERSSLDGPFRSQTSTSTLGSIDAETAAPAPDGDRTGSAVPVLTRSDVQDRIESVVRRILGLTSEVNVSGGVGTTAGWDSLRQIEIVMAVEKEFGIELPTATLATTGQVDRLADAVAQQLDG